MSSFHQSQVQSTSLVSAFYDRFPYPEDSIEDGPPLGFNWRWSVEMVYSACTGAVFPIKEA